MGKRLAGVLLLVLSCLALLAGPALAAEETQEPEELPGIAELGTQSQTSQEFQPEPYEPPAFFRFITYPLLVVGIVVLLVVGFLYLRNLPRFAQESRRSRRR